MEGRTEVYICRLVSMVSFVIVLKPQGPRFDPGLANYVFLTMLAIIPFQLIQG